MSARDIYEADSILRGMISRLRFLGGREQQIKEISEAWFYMWSAFNMQKQEIKQLDEENKKLKAEIKALKEAPVTPVKENKEEKRMPALVYKGGETVPVGRSPAGVLVGKLNFENE